MKLQSAIAIYVLFWVMSAFVVFPFHARTHDEAGIAKVRGQADSAPAHFRPGRIALHVTIVASVAFGMFLLNWTYGWVTPQSLDIFTPKDLRS